MTIFLPTTCGKHASNYRKKNGHCNPSKYNKQINDMKNIKILKKKDKSELNQKKITKNVQIETKKEIIVKVGSCKKINIDKNNNTDNNIKVLINCNDFKIREITCIDDSNNENDKTSDSNTKKSLQIFESIKEREDLKKVIGKKNESLKYDSDKLKLNKTTSPRKKNENDYDRNILSTMELKCKKNTINESCNDTTNIITINDLAQSSDQKKNIESKKESSKVEFNSSDGLPNNNNNNNRRRQKTFPTLEDVLSGEGKSSKDSNDNNKELPKRIDDNRDNDKTSKKSSIKEVEDTINLEFKSDKLPVT